MMTILGKFQNSLVKIWNQRLKNCDKIVEKKVYIKKKVQIQEKFMKISIIKKIVSKFRKILGIL